jgi:nucleoside-diphosphate-sugar epimerase
MDVLVAGGHGQIALRLLRLLADGGHSGRGLIRNADHAPDLEKVGASPVLCDLEHDDPRPHLGGADAIVFAAGAGPGSGPERKRTVDLGAAVVLIDAARELGVTRYVIVSSIGAQDPERGPEAMRPYLRAKAEADEALRASGLEWTIVRPGMLTDAPGAGRVDVSTALGRRAEVPRDDVALVLLECLQAPNTIGVLFELFAGDVPAREAVRALSPSAAEPR